MPVDHVENIKEKARDLAAALVAAKAAGISEGLILPELITVFREAGVIPDELG
jgi:hypothetical protein